MKKLPPIEKIPEAWSALADGRVRMHPDEQRAEVDSSDGTKTYIVTWGDDPKTGRPTYRSNDNATYWRLYAGYPVLAVMMLQGLLPMDREWIQAWKDIPWKAINDANKRDYARALESVMTERGLDSQAAVKAMQDIYALLPGIDVDIRRGKAL